MSIFDVGTHYRRRMATTKRQTDTYERFILREYARRILFRNGAHRAKRPRGDTANWFCLNAEKIGMQAPEIETGRYEELLSPGSFKTWEAFSEELEKRCGSNKLPSPSGLQQRLDWLCETLALDKIEADILGAAVRLSLSHSLGLLVDTTEFHTYEGGIKNQTLAVLAGHSTAAVSHALLPNRPLSLMRLLKQSKGESRLSDLLVGIACLNTTNPTRLAAALIGNLKETDLSYEDFAHLGEEAGLAERLLAGALQSSAPGINILLHGQPGTGKTAFAAVLAKRLGVQPIFVGEMDLGNGEPSRSDRIAAFALARALAAKNERSVLVVDEAEDIFVGVDDGDGRARVGSKVFMNRFVESGQTPTIWITNHPDRLGAAVLRRMALAVHFPTPGRNIRRKVVERIAARQKLKLDGVTVDQLAQIETAPAVLSNAVRVAMISGGVPGDVVTAAQSIQQVLRKRSQKPLQAELIFDPALSAADQDLTRLSDQLVDVGELAVSFCLYGPSGTGKSAFARHIAAKLGLDTIELRASDLLSMWVGSTEQKIADAFRRAADQRAMLILDEADSLLRNRAGARSSWEVSQVNEMLSWMEQHRFPFACTTNLVESLDPATMRRFLFKVRFMPMTPDQSREAFRRTFGIAAPSAVADLNALTPGDFAVAARKARFLGEQSPEACLELLRQEVAMKPGAVMRRIGF